MTTPPVIEFSGVTTSFHDNHVFKDLNFTLEKGESVCLVGTSGSGKTLLVKTAIGLVPPDRGTIKIDGQDIWKISESTRLKLQKKIGMLFQKSGLFDSLHVWENIAFRLLQDKSMTPVEAKEIAIEKLRLVNLPASDADLYPTELSGGMQKRVGLARAIATDPEILLLDEPTAGLDPITSNKINDLILELVDALGVTVLSVNSDMVGAKRLSHRLAMLHDGHIIWTGPSENMFESENEYVDQFVNSRAQGPISTIVFAAG
ncbi:MAG: ATP-binding cassette domain-containing protein [Rhodospirillaceae bacterium]|jgi:phospholipid/cholesterol/gamma-HCH transport system ATP-binding protein|nr:ATP-binding cassette domain-containing protein [Rhodospirillaceae bacterium]MBT8003921.1 ATP-binding cassette domain-containing protein [Rhodospirillales bacterium]MBT4699948.1 ATP-binding cassette domain-containing protein [Rhodospirillaceae bacterium]MBT5034306.1 ATP-binding cassette domain-containing protein [Rhodospirillaceae bacterium]MBT6221702.1 ATP-binding cassette domain-containing protein [Rhodospirillaceae bacterium]